MLEHYLSTGSSQYTWTITFPQKVVNAGKLYLAKTDGHCEGITFPQKSSQRIWAITLPQELTNVLIKYYHHTTITDSFTIEYYHL